MTVTVIEIARKCKLKPDEVISLIQEKSGQTLTRDSILSRKLMSYVIEFKRNQLHELNSFYEYSDRELLEEIKIHNKIDNLIFKGTYSFHERHGFFTNIVSSDDYELFYPILNKVIYNVFTPLTNLSENKVYYFKVRIAPLNRRREQENPFLVNADSRSIKEFTEVSKVERLLRERETVLQQINKQISVNEAKEKLIKTKISELSVNLEQQLEERKAIIEDCVTKLEEKERHLEELSNKEYEMKRTIDFLKSKIGTCKNLEFLTGEEAERYINVLDTKEFEPPEGHLNFDEFDGDFAALSTHVHTYLYEKKQLIYTEFQIKNFLSLLLTNDLIVLSGLSGSGKTQIVKSFAEALGGVAKIIPVKPNWTSSDDLLGYYNPIQSSFLPTPFTEAISEAIQNPNQLYLICLDEMNLARAEYYFADFLSKLEERETQPEIELYAKHEEEQFLSEFQTLLSLMESSIGENEISSWTDFLENDKIRKRFFELLGNTEQETMLQIHSKMKKRLLDILKFPATITIPHNVRFIGAINVDETTHYFSPKILDRVHVVKFENPLLWEDLVKSKMEVKDYKRELKPVYLHPSHLDKRANYPSLQDNKDLTTRLKQINRQYLLPLSIDFGIRSMRQAINYSNCLRKVSDDTDMNLVDLCSVINQKILPRFVFDGNDKVRNENSKLDVVGELLKNIQNIETADLPYEFGIHPEKYLKLMIENAKHNNNQVNFWGIQYDYNFQNEIAQIDVNDVEDSPFS